MNIKPPVLPPNFILSGKSALITGGGGLLGVAHAQALLEIGAKVILTDVDYNSLLTVKKNLNVEAHETIEILEMDVTSEKSIENTLSKIKKLGHRVDILINNAAINPKVSSIKDGVRTTRLENFSLDRWNTEINVGLTGAFLCSKVFGSSMAADGKGGVIINISSDLSVIAPNQKLYRQDDLPKSLQAVKPITYSVVKTGLLGLTRYLASYWADSKVRCNALSPGGVYDEQSEEFVSRIEELIPMGRMARKDEYIGAIQFLCSDASAYLTGQNLVIDGGRSII